MNWKELTREEIAGIQCVKDWLKDVASRRTGSDETAAKYIFHLTNYCNYRQMTPSELLAEGEKVAPGKKRTTVAEFELTDYFVHLEKKRLLKRGSCKTIYGTLRSFFRSHEILFYGKTPSGGSRARSIELPKQRILEVIKAADLYESYAICGLACTGLRPSDFVDLRYGDIRQDYETGKKRLYIEKMSKKEDLWFGVFLNEQTTKLLHLIIEGRKRAGEKFTDKTVLLSHEREGRTGPITAQMLLFVIKRTGEKVGMYLTPKLFRKNFRTHASPVIGRDAVCKMAAWTIPGAGKSYFLPSRSKCLELYLQIEDFFTYEEANKEVEERKKQAITILSKAGIDYRILLRKMKCKTPEEEVKVLNEKIGELLKFKAQPNISSGGLPFEVQARKSLANILVGAIKDVKKELEENK